MNEVSTNFSQLISWYKIKFNQIQKGQPYHLVFFTYLHMNIYKKK
jgi:hypothetical protein